MAWDVANPTNMTVPSMAAKQVAVKSVARPSPRRPGGLIREVGEPRMRSTQRARRTAQAVSGDLRTLGS